MKTQMMTQMKMKMMIMNKNKMLMISIKNKIYSLLINLKLANKDLMLKYKV
jgi:hypothetical protein